MSDLDRKRISAVEMLEKLGYQWADGAWPIRASQHVFEVGGTLWTVPSMQVNVYVRDEVQGGGIESAQSVLCGSGGWSTYFKTTERPDKQGKDK